MKHMFAALFATCLATLAANAQPVTPSAASQSLPTPPADTHAWHLPAHPYRVQLKLDQPAQGLRVVDIDAHELVQAAAEAAIDRVNFDTFAFERALAVDADTGKVVGRFQLMPVASPLEIDGSFISLGQQNSQWNGFDAQHMTLETVELAGANVASLMVEKRKLANTKLTQRVNLTPGRFYLLSYWLMSDPAEFTLSVMLNDPSMKLFAEVPHSYINKMPPRGKWAKQNVLFQPRLKNDAPMQSTESQPFNLDITCAFIGRAGVADMQLQPVAWRLVLDTAKPVDELLLYTTARAGHRFTQPTEAMILHRTATPVQAEITGAAMQPFNARAAYAQSGSHTAWTIDPALPLTTAAVARYKPALSEQQPAAVVDTFRGGSASLIIAIDAQQPRLMGLTATTDLPASVTFHRLATIPVYDGPTVDGQVKGNLIETRYDAMVPLDYALDPPSDNGIHLLVATITPDPHTPAGKTVGSVTLAFGGTTLTLPVQLRVLPIALKPARHFGTIFGGTNFTLSYEKGVAGMVKDSIPMAAFHGIDCQGLAPKTVIGLSIPDNPDARTKPIRTLAEKYFHAMLDRHLLPQSPALYAYYNYKVQQQGDGLAPVLSNWDFSLGFDQAIHTFVIDHDMPWFLVSRTNGHFATRIDLNDGKTYSITPKTNDENWVHLPKEQFYKLVGDYWDTVAKHLDELGVLDRAVYAFDDSSVDTFNNMHAYVAAMRDRPYAKRIKIAYTIQKTSAWTRQLSDGKLLMDDMLDMPIAFNDDHYNFFEPEWNSRFGQKGKSFWTRNVETSHVSIDAAGLSTTLLPLKLQHYGIDGWYYTEGIIWSLPFAYSPGEYGGYKYRMGPVINPWQNPFYHHGPGAIGLFYPPDPRGPAAEHTDLIIPSYRLDLLRDGIQHRALLEALQAGRDDSGAAITVDKNKLAQIQQRLNALWASNTSQWYLSYRDYIEARRQLYHLAMESTSDASH